MNIVDKVKKEPRMIIAVVNFLSFFLPWIAINVSVKVMGASGESSDSISGFGLVSHSVVGIVFYVIPVILFLIPLLKQVEKYSKYLYLVLPVVALILMFMIGAIFGGASGAGVSSGSAKSSIDVEKLIGYWVALVCNVAIIGYTLMRDYNIKSAGDLKQNIQSVDVANITSQLQNTAKEIGNSVQNSVFVECSNCGNKIPKGKKFCSKCGTPVMQDQGVNTQKSMCSNCGFLIGEGTKFCPNCGKSVNGGGNG